jgi:hypothetical protein
VDKTSGLFAAVDTLRVVEEHFNARAGWGIPVNQQQTTMNRNCKTSGFARSFKDRRWKLQEKTSTCWPAVNTLV